MLDRALFAWSYKNEGTKCHVMCSVLTLGKIFSRRHTEIFSYISQKTGFDISCKLSPMETICMKCQILFWGKIRKNIINLSSVELAQRVERLNIDFFHFGPILIKFSPKCRV